MSKFIAVALVTGSTADEPLDELNSPTGSRGPSR